MPFSLGIDLGTTNSSAAVYTDGGVRVLPNRLEEVLTPSVVAVEQDGGLLVGRPAKETMALRPESTAATFKRGMGSDRVYKVHGKNYGAVELSACILRALKQDAESALGAKADSAVITVPAYFNEEQRFATMKAGELAGLEVLRILNEPTAAAMAYGLHDRDRDASFLVFDLGGGTFDVCVMERFAGILQVRSTAGESYLGGEDFTRRLVGVALHEVGLQYERAEMADRAALGLLHKRCELAKRRLSEEEDAHVVVPAFKGLLDRDVPLVLSEFDAEQAWQPLLRRLMAPCRTALRGARLRTTDIDDVILVGGATRMRCVRKFVREFFDKDPATGIDADLAVVHGAAVQAALCERNEAVEDVVVTDVLSHSLGVNISKELAGRRIGGYFSPIIHRNTTIPTSRKDSFFTVDHNQKTMQLDIYEGESRRVEENRLLGKLKVKGIPKGPAGQEVEVTFTYDLNGILGVRAKVTATGKVFEAILSREAKVLSDGELKRAAARLEKLRQDPRRTPRYRDLLLRAEVLWKDLPPEDREMLTAAMDAFEAALETRNQAEILDAYAVLREICERFDDGERW